MAYHLLLYGWGRSLGGKAKRALLGEVAASELPGRLGCGGRAAAQPRAQLYQQGSQPQPEPKRRVAGRGGLPKRRAGLETALEPEPEPEPPQPPPKPELPVSGLPPPPALLSLLLVYDPTSRDADGSPRRRGRRCQLVLASSPLRPADSLSTSREGGAIH